jgi:hypothetical protein
MYDAAGRMSGHLADPRRTAFASNDFLRGTPEEVRQAFEGYFGYFGSYRVNVAAGTVTHHVEGASFPNYAGTDQKRFFTFSADRLNLTTPPTVRGGGRFTYLVVWERERTALSTCPASTRMLPSRPRSSSSGSASCSSTRRSSRRKAGWWKG